METLLSRGFGSRRDSTTRLQGRKQSQGFRSANNNKIAARCSRQEWKKIQLQQLFLPRSQSPAVQAGILSVPGVQLRAQQPGSGQSLGSSSSSSRAGESLLGLKGCPVPMEPQPGQQERTGTRIRAGLAQAKVSESLSVHPLHPTCCILWDVPWAGFGGIWDIPGVPSFPLLSSWGLSFPWNERLLRWVLYLLWEPPLVEAQSPPRVSGASGVTQLYKIQRSLCMRREGLKPQVYQ